jgi:predicted transcriptional regulator of viral defense system
MHMSKNTNQTAKVLKLAKTLGFLRVKDLLAHGIHHEHLHRLCSKGALLRTGRGIYRLAEADISENITLAAVTKRIPNGVVCLLSALRFHNIGTQNPPDVWIALKQRTAPSREKDLPLRIVWFSDASYATGTETHILEGVTVRITNPAKTVADCFKYRNKIGLDVALEALKECRRKRRCSPSELWKYAKVCRVTKVMRPYLEAVE